MARSGFFCRYIYGSTVNVCECPDGYTGPKCEEKKENSLSKEGRRQSVVFLDIDTISFA